MKIPDKLTQVSPKDFLVALGPALQAVEVADVVVSSPMATAGLALPKASERLVRRHGAHPNELVLKEVVRLTAQSDPSENGLWVAARGEWTRSPDAWATSIQSEQTRRLLTAMVQRETSFKFIHNFNFGNTKRKPSGEGDWCFFPCNERINGKIKWFYPDDPGCCFSAYHSIEEGVTAWIKILRRDFPGAWDSLIWVGEPKDFVLALKVGGYFTATFEAYWSTYAEIIRELDRAATRDDFDLFTVSGQQGALDKLGYSPGPIDGIFGPKTLAAVLAFQTDHGLLVDGIVGRFTRAALGQALDALAVPSS